MGTDSIFYQFSRSKAAHAAFPPAGAQQTGVLRFLHLNWYRSFCGGGDLSLERGTSQRFQGIIYQIVASDYCRAFAFIPLHYFTELMSKHAPNKIAAGNAGWLVQFRFAAHVLWSRVPELWTFCGVQTMSAPFQFTVTDTFLIEGRGLILSPFFPVDRYRFDSREHVRVETPSGRIFEAEAAVEIPFVTPRPKVFQSTFVIHPAQKEELPIGSSVSLPQKSAEQIAAPNGGPTKPSGNSTVSSGPPWVS